MSALWLLLYLGGLVHLLALYGYDPMHGWGALALLPVLLLLLLPRAARRWPALLDPLLVRGMGLLGFACALLFARELHLAAWDAWRLGPTLLSSLAGMGSLWAALADPSRPTPGTWIWIAAWLLAGYLDPALPLLGAGLGGVLSSSGFWPAPPEEFPPALALRRAWLAFLLLGLVLPKPWWDFGLVPAWALPTAALGLGGALAAWAPLRDGLARVPEGLLCTGLGLLFVLYWPTWGLPWGLALGLLAGSLWTRLDPSRWEGPGLAFLAGLLLSFTLHANAWIPGLRHLIWLGN